MRAVHSVVAGGLLKQGFVFSVKLTHVHDCKEPGSRP
jgi:hypothetical protein